MPTVLIIEDHTDTRNILLRLLKQWGLHGEGAGGGVEAITMLERGVRANVVIGDVDLPDCNGAQLLHDIRQNRGSAVIAMTADAMDSAQDRYRALRLDRVLIKPISAEALKQALEQLLGVALFAARPSSAPRPPDPPINP